jgi:hypothetical protein
MVDYPFSKVEVRLSNGDTIKGLWLTAHANYVTVRAEDGTLFYIPYTSILFLKLDEPKPWYNTRLKEVAEKASNLPEEVKER